MPGRRASPAASGRLTPSAPIERLRQPVRAAEKADTGRKQITRDEVVVGGIDLAQSQGGAAAREVLDQIDGELLALVAMADAGPLDDVERPEGAGLRRQHHGVSAEAAAVLQRRGHQPLHLGAIGTAPKVSEATRSRPPSSACSRR